MNESKLNNRMLHLMESGFFGKQKLNEGNLGLSERMNVMIFQSIHNFFNESNAISVDGVAGKNTANVINGKQQNLGYDFANDFSNELKGYYKVQLNKIKSKNLSYLKKLNNIHNARMLQVVLCLAGRTEVIPDGVVGSITKAAMKELFGFDDMAKVEDAKIKEVIDVAIANVGASNLSFNVSGLKVSSGNTNASSGNTNASSGNTNASSEKSSFTSKFMSSGAYDAIFVAGITTGEGIDSQIKYFKNGFGKDKNVAAFFLNGTPHGHKQSISQVLADNPKIPAFLFSAGAGQVYNIASNGNADVNKIFVIEPYYAQGQTVKPKIDAAIASGVPANHIYVGAYAAVGLGVVADATPTKSGNHFLAVTEVARNHNMA